MAKKKAMGKLKVSVTRAFPYFEIFADVAGEWRWRIKARNDQIIGTSGEGYATHSAVLVAINNLNSVDWPLAVEEAETAKPAPVPPVLAPAV